MKSWLSILLGVSVPVLFVHLASRELQIVALLLLSVWLIPRGVIAAARHVRLEYLTARWKRRRAAGQCLRCGYDLIGNVSGTCPECGTPAPVKPSTGAPA